MTDVSNARRIGFTALALVAFWVLAWRAYLMGRDGFVFDRPLSDATAEYCVVLIGVALLLALLPTLLLYVSIHGVSAKRPAPWILHSGFGFTCTSGFGYWLGVPDPNTVGIPPRYRLYFPQDAGPSWVWVFIPIILTTAVVIFGAWAMWDAEVEAEGEDG